jgi:hypothetical protein
MQTWPELAILPGVIVHFYREAIMNIPTKTIQFHIDMLNDKARTSSYLTSIRKLVRQ